MADRILVLGVGNILLGDEGFGVHAARWLMENRQWPENIRLLDGGTLGLMLMAEFMETDVAIILDIARGGGQPGCFYRLDDGDMARSLSIRDSAHHTGIEDVLISCELAGHRPKTVVFAMEPFDCQTLNPALTPEAERRLPLFCAKVLNELARMGIAPLP